jgi:predicted Fe-Mo cluster-binding NifX family protein
MPTVRNHRNKATKSIGLDTGISIASLRRDKTGIEKQALNDLSNTKENTMTKKTIAIAAEDNKGLAGDVSYHFGRCPYYVVVETEGEKCVDAEVTSNPFFGNHEPGQMPKYIHDLGADVILAGGMGPRAVQLFHQYGIEVATGAVGKVESVLQAYLSGDLKGIVPCNHDHPDSCGGH